MAKSLQEARGLLISDIETLNNLLSSLGETWGKRGVGTQAGAECRDLGKGQAVGVQGSPAHWIWVSCLLTIQAELHALWLRSLRVLAKLLGGSCLEESPCAK